MHDGRLHFQFRPRAESLGTLIVEMPALEDDLRIHAINVRNAFVVISLPAILERGFEEVFDNQSEATTKRLLR